MGELIEYFRLKIEDLRNTIDFYIVCVTFQREVILVFNREEKYRDRFNC